VGAAADVVPNNDDCPPNGVALDAAVDAPKTPPPKGDVAGTSSDMLLLLSTGADGLDDISNASSGELPLSPQLDEENERLLPSVSLRTAPKGFCPNGENEDDKA